MPFTHLHVHTEFSLLDGFCKIKELPEVIKSMGQTACAITDHGVMYGVIDFYRACKAVGYQAHHWAARSMLPRRGVPGLTRYMSSTAKAGILFCCAKMRRGIGTFPTWCLWLGRRAFISSRESIKGC